MHLSIQHVTMTYGEQTILHDVSFDIPANKVCGLVGINGSGKSTLMKIIMGLIRPTSGTVLINGQPLQRDNLDQMGALIESPPLYNNLTAYENLKVKSLVTGINDERIKQTMEIMGLEDTKKRVGHYSMGMKMRLGIALAILTRPEFVILDEPTNGLDPLGIKELKILIRQLSQQGTTVLISSHQLKDVAEVSDHIIMIDRGRLAYDGSGQSTANLEKLFFEIVNG